MKQVALFILLASVGAPPLASATPITWQWSAKVSGSVVGSHYDPVEDVFSLFPIPIPPRTPMTFTATFDSNAPNLCPPEYAGSGTYLFTNVTLNFLGNRQSAYNGAIESNSAFAGCVHANNETIFRVFFSGPYFMPNGTPFAFSREPSWHFVLDAPAPATPGGLPTTLPYQPFPTGIRLSGGEDTADLTFDSVHLTVVPEPGTLILVGSGLALAAWRRRRVQTHSAARTSL